MASTHVYDLTGVKEKPARSGFGLKDSSTVELALDPSELDMVDTAAMEARYEQTLKEKQAYSHGEDLSDMVAEHTAKQKVCSKRVSSSCLHRVVSEVNVIFDLLEQAQTSNAATRYEEGCKETKRIQVLVCSDGLRITATCRIFMR